MSADLIPCPTCQWRSGAISLEERDRQYAIIDGQKPSYSTPVLQNLADFAEKYRINNGFQG